MYIRPITIIFYCEEMNEEIEKTGGSRKKLIVGIVVAVILIAVIFFGLKAFQSNMGITPPSPIIKLDIVNGEYVWNVTAIITENVYPNVDWYNLDYYAFFVTDAQYGYYYYTNTDAIKTNTSHISSGIVSDYLNSSLDIVYYDNDFDHDISNGDSLVFRGDLAVSITQINENLSLSSDELWLNIFFIGGNENGLGDDTFYLVSRPFYELEYENKH